MIVEHLKITTMKTLEQIIERNDYKVVSDKMRKRCVELAEKLLKGCRLIGLDDEEEFRLGGLVFTIRTLKPRCGFTEDIIYLHYNGVMEAINREMSYHFCNDYNFYVNSASNKAFLEFLNHAKDVFSDLEIVGNELVADMGNAIKEMEAL